MRGRTAPYRMITSDKGRRYHFFCEVSGMLVATSNPTFAQTEEDALYIAWERDGKNHFNRCQKCGKWVSDEMYNADTLNCAICTPWEDTPHFCSQCGQRVDPDDVFCRKCGSKLRYREVE